MTNYIKVSLNIKEEDFDKAVFILENYKFCGIEEKLDELQITFEEEYWTEKLKKTLLFELIKIIPTLSIKSENIIINKNWNEEWEKNLKPVIINDRICITPEAKANEIDREIKLLINPKMSFGTGEHATTRLTSNLMTYLVKKDSYWIDAGTGTGVLAILAIKLGARYCYAFDNDDWSVENSIENVNLNNVAETIKVEKADIEQMEIPESDGIVANLFIHLIKASMPMFYKSLAQSKGDLIVSGIMYHDADKAIKAAEEAGFTLKEKIQEDEWNAFHFIIK